VDRILEYLQNDPLHRPYFLNDMLNLAGLMYTAKSFGQGELSRCGEILDRVKGKFQDMEWHLSAGFEKRVPPPEWAAGCTENPCLESHASAQA
jgi:hypothetical protein